MSHQQLIFDPPKVGLVTQFSEGETINLYHGNVLDFVKTIPSNRVQLIITSPPYNIGKEYETQRNIQTY